MKTKPKPKLREPDLMERTRAACWCVPVVVSSEDEPREEARTKPQGHMTPTAQPVEPSKEAIAAAHQIIGNREMQFASPVVMDFTSHIARLIDSSFAELRRERDELREHINTQCRCTCSPAPKAPWCPKCSILRRIKEKTPDAGRGE